jgi:hypothetical protein
MAENVAETGQNERKGAADCAPRRGGAERRVYISTGVRNGAACAVRRRDAAQAKLSMQKGPAAPLSRRRRAALHPRARPATGPACSGRRTRDGRTGRRAGGTGRDAHLRAWPSRRYAGCTGRVRACDAAPTRRRRVVRRGACARQDLRCIVSKSLQPERAGPFPRAHRHRYMLCM